MMLWTWTSRSRTETETTRRCSKVSCLRLHRGFVRRSGESVWIWGARAVGSRENVLAILFPRKEIEALGRRDGVAQARLMAPGDDRVQGRPRRFGLRESWTGGCLSSMGLDGRRLPVPTTCPAQRSRKCDWRRPVMGQRARRPGPCTQSTRPPCHTLLAPTLPPRSTVRRPPHTPATVNSP